MNDLKLLFCRILLELPGPWSDDSVFRLHLQPCGLADRFEAAALHELIEQTVTIVKQHQRLHECYPS